MKINKIILILGISFLLAGWILFIHIFMTAYNNDSKTVVVNINDYGEANFELIGNLISIPFVVITVIVFLFMINQNAHNT